MTVYVSRRTCCDLCGATITEDERQFMIDPPWEPPPLPYEILVHGRRYTLCNPCSQPLLDAMGKQIDKLTVEGRLYDWTKRP